MDIYKITITPFPNRWKQGEPAGNLLDFELYFTYQPTKEEVAQNIATVIGPHGLWCKDWDEENWLKQCIWGVESFGVPKLHGSCTAKNVQWCFPHEPYYMSKGSTETRVVYVNEKETWAGV